MKKIIIVGYPKSGNTWLSRLTAALVNCPVEGFLYSNHQETAIEGTDRESEFGVYKSHHQLSELSEEDVISAKIIYIIRDPRDVSISGRNYFLIPRFSSKKSSRKGFIPQVIHTLEEVTTKILEVVMTKLFIKSEMNKAVLYGNKNISPWCRISWKTHITPYINNSNILKVQYESVLSDPLAESKRILNFVGIRKEEENILRDIDLQSFAKKKAQFLNEHQMEKANFLKKGKKEQWKTLFSKKENQLFVNVLKKELIALGYDLVKVQK